MLEHARSGCTSSAPFCTLPSSSSAALQQQRGRNAAAVTAAAVVFGASMVAVDRGVGFVPVSGCSTSPIGVPQSRCMSDLGCRSTLPLCAESVQVIGRRPSSVGDSASVISAVAIVGPTLVATAARHRHLAISASHRTRRRSARAASVVGTMAVGEGVAASTNDRLVRYLGCDGTVSVRALVATDLVQEAIQRHGTSPAGAVALGRSLMGTILLASGRDAGETLQVRFNGDGPCGTIITEADSKLQCRGFLGEPEASAATIPELIGVSDTSTIRVTRMHPYWKTPYSGTSLLKSGEIAEDIVNYLATSEGQPASMGLQVDWDQETGRVRHAEGWLVTVLPGWDEVTMSVVETNINTFGRMSHSNQPRPEAICEHFMRELVGSFVCEEHPILKCSCSPNRLLTAVMMFGKLEVLRILREKETVDARCDWCGLHLSVTPDEIREHMKTDDGKEQVESKQASPRQLKLQEDELQAIPEPGTADWS